MRLALGGVSSLRRIGAPAGLTGRARDAVEDIYGRAMVPLIAAGSASDFMARFGRVLSGDCWYLVQAVGEGCVRVGEVGVLNGAVPGVDLSLSPGRIEAHSAATFVTTPPRPPRAERMSYFGPSAANDGDGGKVGSLRLRGGSGGVCGSAAF